MATTVKIPHYKPLFIPAIGELLVGEVLQALTSAWCKVLFEDDYDLDNLIDEIDLTHDVRISHAAVMAFMSWLYGTGGEWKTCMSGEVGGGSCFGGAVETVMGTP